MVSREADFFIDYVKASRTPPAEAAKACDIFLRLSSEKKFILNDVAHVRSLQVCDSATQAPDWDRPVPVWLEKDKKLLFYQTLSSPLQRALFVQQNPQILPPPERVQIYQAGLAADDITSEQQKLLSDSLYNLAPRFMPKPPAKEFLRIVKDLKSVRQLDKAREYLKQIITGKNFSSDEKWAAHKELFLTLKLQKSQRKQEYLQAAKSWAQFYKIKDLPTAKLPQFYEAQINQIRVVWTDLGTDQALKALDDLQKILKGRMSLYEIHWYRARMYEEKKSFDLAVTELEKALKEPISQWRDKERILWSLAWSYYKSRKYVEAEAHLNTVANGTETSPFAKFKYLFWKAQALKNQNKLEDARDIWRQVSTEDVFGYYSILSAHELDQPLRSYDIKEFKPDSILSADDQKLFLALQKVEELDLATRLLTALTNEPTFLKNASTDKIASYFYFHSLIKNYKIIFSTFSQLAYEQQRDIFLKIPRILFPRPYEDLVDTSARQFSMEPELIYSIMRQESSFDPKARSPMDAFGLLQILPEVSKKIARDHKLPYTQFEDLYEPTKNIPIGTALLKKQSDMFKGKFILYVASYNASSWAVRQWRTRYTGDDLVFIEDIPYEETKTYVKLVLRNLMLYKKLKGGDDFLKFPRAILDLSEPAETPVNTADSPEKNIETSSTKADSSLANE